MGLLLFLVLIFLSGFVIGGLARFAVPGPDPMPIWLTALFGIAGSMLGGLVTRIFFGTTGGFVAALAGAILLVVLYRRIVQKRGITGPEAKQMPTRGVGIRR